MESIASAMTHEEAFTSGLDPFVGDSFDNMAIEGMLRNNSGLPQQDSRGRPIIGYRQYLEMKRRDMRVDNYVLRMVGPSGRGLIQASKLHKYIGEGYMPIEEYESKQRKARKTYADDFEREATGPKATVIESDEDYVIYKCADRFPDCSRYFDSQRALQTHWGMPKPSGHGEKGFASKGKAKEVVQKAVYAAEHGTDPSDDDLSVTYTPNQDIRYA